MNEALTDTVDRDVTVAVNGMLRGHEDQRSRKQRERDLQLVALGVLLRDVASMDPSEFTDGDIRSVVSCISDFSADNKRQELLSLALDWFRRRLNVEPDSGEKLHQAVLRRLRDVSVSEKMLELSRKMEAASARRQPTLMANLLVEMRELVGDSADGGVPA